MTTGYQAFIQLQTPTPDGTTRWHSMSGCTPTAVAALAESAHFVGGLWLRAQHGDPAPTHGNPAPTQYLLTAHGKVYVRIAVVPCDHPHAAAVAAVPDDAVFYELAYPPPYVDGALTFAAAARPA
jgi:hypothetical protein